MNRIVAAFLLALVASGTTEAAQVPFAERRVAVGTINDPARIALADLDGDGDLDIVAASRADSTITWHENLGGRGAFVTRPIATPSSGVTGVLAADIDRNGRVDVVFSTADGIGWFPNSDGRNFLGAETIAAEIPGISSIAAADFNGDGYVDIVWTEAVLRRLVLARNPLGTGGLWSLQSYPAVASGAPYRSVAFADVDEDGDLDIFTASDDQFVVIESLQGTLVSEVAISSVGIGGNAIVAADIDRDGDPDALTASCSTSSIVWYETRVDDGWYFDPRVIDGAAPCPESVSAADVDGDGDLDVVAANSASPNGGTVWYENLAGAFGPPRPLPGSAGGQTDAVAADVDGDGDLDLVSASGASSSVGWNENRTIHRNAAFPLQSAISGGLSYTAASVADLNGDGTPDVLGGAGQDEALEVYYGDGTGEFPDDEDVSSGVWLLEAVAAADVDRDGDLDIVAAHDRLSWFENTITFDASFPLFGNDEFIAPDGDFRSIAVTDLNRDGWPDFVTGEGPEGSGLENLVAWMHGGPDGALAISWKATAPVLDCAGPTDDASRPWSDPAFDDTSWSPIALPDVWFASNDDRFYRGTFTYTGAPRPHLLHFSSDDGLQVYVNGVPVVSFPDPFFCQPAGCVNATTCAVNTSIPSVDITSLLVPGTNVIAAHVTNGPGIGRFNASVAASGVAWFRDGIASPGETVRSVATGDLDGDGDPDVVAGGAACEECGTGFAHWYENVGGGGLEQRDALATTGDVRAVAVGDVDRDGRPDVVVGTTNAIVWYRNTPPEISEEAPPLTFSGSRPVTSEVSSLRALSLVDLDGDGDLDVASVSEQDSKVAWYANDGKGGFGPQLTVTSSLGNPNVLAIADLDRDGRIDLLSASESDRDLKWNRNLGGQFTLGATDLAPPLATVGELTPLLGVTMTLNARGGDPAGALTSLDLLLADASGIPLTPPEANALVESLYVYRDDGSGAFEESRDVQVAAVDNLLASAEGTSGREVITFSEDDSELRVAAPATFFVVVRMAPGAVSAVPDRFRVTLLSPGAGGATSVADSSSGIVLTAEFTPSFASGVTKALAPIVVDTEPDVFSPEDGLTGLREAITRANQNPGEDRIQIGAGVYFLTQIGFGEDVAATGDLDLTDTTGRTVITGAGADVTIIDATGLEDRVFHVLPGAIVEISGVTIRNGLETRGGGILNQGTLSIADSVLTGNTASQNGGAIHNGAEDGDAVLTVARSSITGNNSGNAGGGIGNVAFDDSSTASLTVVDTTIAGNSADDTAGGVANYSQFGGEVVAELVNVTLSGNATSSNAGGAIDHGAINGGGAASLTLTNTTVFGNTSAFNGGGIHTNSSTDTLVLRNSIVAGNTSASGISDIASGDTLVQLDGGNVIGSDAGLNASLTSSDQVGTGSEPIDVRLGPLAPNGGPTPTHQPLADSPALDAGFCSAIALDQAGQARVVDLPSVANRAGGNGCDAGSVELSLAKTLPLIGIPLRWCALAGAPSIAAPPPGETANDVLRNRGRKVSEGVYVPDVAMQFRSGASAMVLDFPVLDTTGLAFGAQGDVFVDPKARNFDEFTLLVNRCRDAWKGLDPRVTGITAIHINRFVDVAGQPIELLGLGGRAELGNAAQQVNAGRVMVADDFYRESSNPADTLDRLLGHELGHALSLEHGDGVDNDANGKLDDDDDKVANRARFDGPNLMQYRNGDQISPLQVQQLRAHAITTIPDITLTINGQTEVAAAGIDSGFANVLDFGFANVLDFGFANVLDFGFSQVLDFQFAQVLDFGFAGVLDFGFAEVLDFGFANVLDFGMVFDGDVDGSTTLLSTTGGLPWPSPIRPTTTYYYYMDLDQNVATGGTPSAAGFPATPDDPAGIDLVAETTLSSTCAGSQCDDTVAMRLFRHDGAGYVLVPEGEPALERVSVGLFQDSGGAEVEPENLAVGVSVQAKIPNDVMALAGWTIGAPVRMQALTVVDCPGVDLTLPNGITTINCRCDSCATCPDYPGCTGTTGTPDALPEGGRIVVDATPVAPLSFEKPVLPECSVAPGTAGPGGRATVHVTGFPSGQSGRRLVAVTGEQELGSTDAATIAGGAGSVPIVLPGALNDGVLAITVGISGLAAEARCPLTISNDTCASDSEPPVIGTVAPITQELTSVAGTPLSVPLPGATDDCDPQPTVTSDAPASFPLGETTVTFTARDAAGNESTSTTTVTIVDTTDPSIACPASVTVECAGNGQAAVNLPAAVSSDLGGGAAPIENSHTAGGADASGSYPLGTTVVVFTATDGSGNSASCQTSVTVRDTLAPVVSIVASPGTLWPPNHKMTTVTATVSAVDVCDPNPSLVLVSVSSNEPDDAPGGGDGHTTNDIQGVSVGTADFQVQLRAERAGKGVGRAYTLTYRATDQSGRTATSSKDVLAPLALGDVVEPLHLLLEGRASTRIAWDPVFGAADYDVVRGELASLRIDGSNVDLGTVTCIESDSLDTDTTGHEDDAVPQPGQAFFYAVQFFDGIAESSYGSVSVGRARVVRNGVGNCP